MVFEAIYYDNGSNGVQNHSNQFVVANVKNNHVINDSTIVTRNETAPSALTTVLQCNKTSSSSTPSNTLQNGTIVKKPGIILLTQASLSKLLSSSDLNVINNNSNTNTANHVHSHQNDSSNTRSKCNFATFNSTITTNPNPSQNNNHLKTVLMINSTSTIETTAGIVTLTPSTGPTQSAIAKRDSTDENGKSIINQQVRN